MIDIKEIASTIYNIKKNRNVLDILIEFERILDDLHIYAYENWDKGEVIKGPLVSKYWVEVFLMYNEKDMPNPDASKRLTKHGCFVFFKKDKLKSNVKIRNSDSLTYSPSRKRLVPKTKASNVWIVKIVMPRHLLSEYNVKKISALADEISVDDIIDAYDKGLDAPARIQASDENEN